MSLLESDYHSHLKDEAEKIRSSYSRLAVPVGRIAFDHGVSIERSSQLEKFKAHLALPKDHSDWAKIILPLRASSACLVPSAYDRFCVAHELAHLILYRRFGVKPNSRSAYWQHEVLCDEFARRLLIPSYLFDRIDWRKEPIAQAVDIQKITNVPFMHVARRVTEHVLGIYFLRVRRESEYWRVESSSLKDGKMTGAVLKGFLSTRLRAFQEGADTVRAWRFSGSVLASGNLRSSLGTADYRMHGMKLASDGDAMILSLQPMADMDTEPPE